jgi:hypothetical protein
VSTLFVTTDSAGTCHVAHVQAHSERRWDAPGLCFGCNEPGRGGVQEVRECVRTYLEVLELERELLLRQSIGRHRAICQPTDTRVHRRRVMSKRSSKKKLCVAQLSF